MSPEKQELTELAETLEEMQEQLKNWNALFPYEKQALMRKLRQVVFAHHKKMDTDLTAQTLAAIDRLTISR